MGGRRKVATVRAQVDAGRSLETIFGEPRTKALRRNFGVRRCSLVPKKGGPPKRPPRVKPKPARSRKDGSSRPAYPLPGTPVRANVLDPSEADSVVGLDVDHRSHLLLGWVAIDGQKCDSLSADRGNRSSHRRLGAAPNRAAFSVSGAQRSSIDCPPSQARPSSGEWLLPLYGKASSESRLTLAA
jgi:hypothetical protein